MRDKGQAMNQDSKRPTSRDVRRGENCDLVIIGPVAATRLFAERVRGVHVRDLELNEVWTYVEKWDNLNEIFAYRPIDLGGFHKRLTCHSAVDTRIRHHLRAIDR